MRAFFKRYFADTTGNFAIIFAVSIGVLLLISAVAMTILQLHSRKQSLNDAADAAVIAAVQAVSEELVAANPGDWEQRGQDVGGNIFKENIASIEGISEVDFDLDLSLASGNKEIFGELTYRTTGTAFLPNLLGRDDIEISETVSAAKRLFTFSRINFVVDISSSMAVGADVANQDLLRDNIGCAVACHLNGSLDTARSLGIELRIDTVKAAVQQMITDLNEISGQNNEFQVAIYTFSNSLAEHLAPTTDLGSAITAVNSIEIASAIGQTGTNFHNSLQELNLLIPAGGEGSRTDNRASYVVVLTDGVENSAQQGPVQNVRDPNFTVFEPSMTFGPHETIQGFDPFVCQGVRANHIVAFINPTYLIPDVNTSQDKYDFIKDTLIASIEVNSQTCASDPDFAFSAETEAQVEQASRELFDDLLASNVRLTK